MSSASHNGGRPGGTAGMETSRANPMRVKKDTQRIFMILTDQTRIKGLVHLPQSGRLSDLMNHQAGDRPFLAMTDAVVRLPDGVRHKAEFLTVNRSAVTTCFPAPEEEEAAKPAVETVQPAEARPPTARSRPRASSQAVGDPRRALPGAPNVPVSSRPPGP